MLDQALLTLIKDGEFHSETQLAEALNTSVVGVTSAIENLKNLGLAITHDPKLGFQLDPEIKLLDRATILAALPRHVSDSFTAFDIHLTIDSTSSEAMRLARAGFQGKALVVAEKQDKGRGRRGRNWISPIARNIYMTLLMPFHQNIEALQGLSLVTALSLVEALQKSDLDGMENLQVKWPNDVWLNKMKLAGILLELHKGAEDYHNVIIGIGLNVDMPYGSLSSIEQAATDLASHTDKKVDRNIILAKLIEQLDSNIELFMQSGFDSFRQNWQLLDVYYEQQVEVQTGSNTISGKAKGVNQSGALILETKTGVQLIMGGELAPSIRATS